MPPIRWRAVLSGLAIALLVALLARLFLATLPGLVVTIFGIGAGGYLAGKWAGSAGVYHGALVGAGWIALEVVGLVTSPAYSTDVVTDTLIVIAIDLVTLFASSLGGWLGAPGPSSSSGTGRGR